MIRNDLIKIIDDKKYKFCAEIGVQNGFFSEVLLESKLEKLYLIDSWKYLENYFDIANISNEEQEKIYLEVINKFKSDDRVKIIRKLSQEAHKDFDDNSLDFVYLDADHSYEKIKEDIEEWFKKIKKGGMLAGHDYLDGNIPSGIFGVKSAIDEFVEKNKLKLYLTDENEWRSWFFVKEE